MVLVVQLVVLSFAPLQAQVSCLNKRSSGKWIQRNHDWTVGISVSYPCLQVRNKVNPIRRVVTLLQEMVKKITEEGEQKAAMYENLECYCGTQQIFRQFCHQAGVEQVC